MAGVRFPLTDDNPDGQGKKKLSERADSKAERSPVSQTDTRRRRGEAGGATVRLGFWSRDAARGHSGSGIDLSGIVVEMPLLELTRIVPPRSAMRLCDLVCQWFAAAPAPALPAPLAAILKSRSLLVELRRRLTTASQLAELIAEPPTILLDARQRLFFYRGVPVPLRPVSFSYLLLLAQSPREVVPREAIYRRLWPGELDYEGGNKPYEAQVSDHKRKLMAQIRRGLAGKLETQAGELEALIQTRSKAGYILDCNRESVVILSPQDYAESPLLLFLMALGQCMTDWLDWLGEAPELLRL